MTFQSLWALPVSFPWFFMTSLRSRVIFGCRAAWGATASQLPAALRRASRPRKKSAETRTRSAPELHSPPGPFLEPFELHVLGRWWSMSWCLLIFHVDFMSFHGDDSVIWGEIWGVNRQSYGARIGQWWFILGNLMVHETSSFGFLPKKSRKSCGWIFNGYKMLWSHQWNDVDITGILKQLWFTANGDVSSKVKGA